MATVSSTVELLIKAQQPQRALSALTQSTDKLKQRLNATQGAFNKAGQAGTTSAKRAGTAYKNLGTEVSGVNKIVRTLRTSFVALGGAVTASGILQAGTDAIEAERRIKLLAASSGETEAALEVASRAASKFGLSSTEANEGVARLLARLKPMGVSLEDIESTFAGFNIAAKLAGATASESSGAFLQLTQALGSGVLRGQELNSILEQAPLIATAIALEMDTATGSLKKLGEEGKITSQIVLAALKRVETEGAEKLEEAMRGPAQQFKNLRNAGVELSKVLTKTLLPAIIPLVQGATNLLKSFNELPAGIQTFIITTTLATGAVVALSKTIAILVASKLGAFLAQQIALFQVFGAKIYFAAAAAGALKIAMAALPFGAVALGVGLLTTALINNNRKQKEFNDLIKFGGEEALKAAIKVEQLRKTQAQQRIDEAGPTGRMGKNSPFQRRMRRIIADADERIAKLQKRAGEIKVTTPRDDISDADQKRLAKLKQQNIAAKERLFESQEELAILRETNKVEKIKLQFAAKRSKVQRDFASLLSQSLSEEERGNLVAALRNELEQLSLEQNQAITNEIRSQFDAAMKFNGQLVELIPETNKLSEEFKSISDTINNEIINGIQGMIDGTKTLGEVATSMLKQVANQMLQMAIMGKQGSGGLAGTLISAVGSIFGAPSLAGPGGFTISDAATPMTSGLDFSSAFANGGRPPVGKAALVGERGPELFVPKTAGTIIPNNAMGGSTSIVVNVDASGSSVEGDEGSASQLGKMLGSAIQAELVKQKRPGGLLAT